jgi:hypothetical protein
LEKKKKKSDICQKEHDFSSQSITPTGSTSSLPQDSTPASTSEGLTSVLADMSLSPFKKDLMTRLDIPFNLADRKDSSLHFAYQKYKAFL